MSALHEYVHLIPNLEVYPRVYYFNKRYIALHDKLSRLQDKHREERFDADWNILQNGLAIKVIGKCDLSAGDYLTAESHLYRVQTCDPSQTDACTDYIVAVDPYKDKVESPKSPSKGGLKFSDCDIAAGISQLKIDHSSSPDTTVIIYFANIQELNDDGLREVRLLSDRLSNSTDIHRHECFLFCRCSEEFTKTEEDAFRRKLASYGFFDHVVIGKKTGEEISSFLEMKLARCFVELQQYIRNQMGQSQRNPLEADVVKGQILDFLHSSIAYSEPIEPVLEGEEPTHKVIRRLARTVRCALVHPLSEKYNLRVWICNRTLVANDFEKKLTDKISESERIKLENQENYAKEIIALRGGKVPSKLSQENLSTSILSSLQTELEDVVIDIGRKLNRPTLTMKKMLLEISACLKKMKTTTAQSILQSELASKTVDNSFRKDILSISEVYGVGTIYGQFVIHVNNESDVKPVGAKVVNLFKEKNVPSPFVVRAIHSKPKIFADSQYEHGEMILCSTRTGTLGGFLDGSDNHLYGLTCAHVIKGHREEEDIFINNGPGNQQVLFARSVRNMIVSTGEDTKPLIDIAAVRVVDGVKHKCIKFLKDDNGMIRPAILPYDSTVELVGTYVYKHGAITQCTKGLVCSDDYSILNADELTYIILIDNYDDDDIPFAERGDSGSMICAPDEDEVYVVKATGVFSAGEFTPADRDTPLYFSFRLCDGLRKLTTNAGGVQFSFPKDCF